MEDKVNALLEDVAGLKARVDALEEAVVMLIPSVEDTPAPAAKNKPALSGESFKVGGEEYQLKYPVINIDGKEMKEAEILADKSMRERLLKNHPGLFRKVAAMLALVFAFALTLPATSVTITPTNAEVISTTDRAMYALQDLLIIYRSSTGGFEVQTSETRSKVWGGVVDSVTISGASTTAAKLAYLRTLMLEATTTGGYRVFIGRNNVEYNYKISTNRLDIKHGRNKQPLWFGSIDSLQSGPSGSANKLAFLRLIHTWDGKMCLPTASAATIAAGAAAGSSPTVSVTGDAYSGSISVTTGTTATTGTLATVTLKITAPTGTRISLTPTGNNSLAQIVRARGSGTTTTLVLTVPTTALSDATAYTWDYTVTPY